MKRTVALILILGLALCLFAGCARTGPKPAATEAPAAEPVELIVFAAASMTETMNKITSFIIKQLPCFEGGCFFKVFSDRLDEFTNKRRIFDSLGR